jgi:hypothetical protein
MDDEKSIAKKLTTVISKAADTVKHAVSHVVESASEAAQHAMEANAEKIARIPPARSDPGQVAATTNEQVYIPEANDAAAMPMPLVPVARAAKTRKPQARAAPEKKPAARKAARMVKKSSPKGAADIATKRARTKAAAKKTAKSAAKSRGRSATTARGRSRK